MARASATSNRNILVFINSSPLKSGATSLSRLVLVKKPKPRRNAQTAGVKEE